MEEIIAQLVAQGYTSGEGWELDIEESVRADELAMEHIAGLIREGYTSGYHPSWDLTIFR